ncbi:DUF308 domain-containing protein [Candidatus Saccharibacteria bacterium]|nr:DUF308 domain-containing protein [Candidatus Saccharibacteria bacterium]
MNKLIKRGFSAYKIFLKNKLAAAFMMFIPGVMMFIGALNGRGNDTVGMPLGITAAGAVFTFWACYQAGRIKSDLDRAEDRGEQRVQRKLLIFQILEGLLYLAVMVAGILLLINQGFVDKVLNLMAGGFTTLNGITGAIKVFKRRDEKDYRWYFKLVLTLLELVVGPYYFFASDSISSGWFMTMAILTMVAGAVEVISALTPESLKSAMRDSKEIVRIMKDEPDEEDEE